MISNLQENGTDMSSQIKMLKDRIDQLETQVEEQKIINKKLMSKLAENER